MTIKARSQGRAFFYLKKMKKTLAGFKNSSTFAAEIKPRW